MQRTNRRTILPVLVLAIAALPLVACSSAASGGTGFGGTPAGGQTTAAVTTATAAAPPLATAAAPAAAATLAVSDQGGDAASVTVKVGPTLPAKAVGDPAVGICSGAITQAGSSLERTVAVPIEVDVRVTSSLATKVTVDLSNTDVVTSNGRIQLAYETWAKEYSSGPQCTAGNDFGSVQASVTWQSLNPGITSAWHAWIIIAGAITPNDPTGAHSDAGHLLLTPVVTLAGGNPYAETTSYTDSAGVVQCYGEDPAAGMVGYIAVNPGVAEQAGCRV